MYEITSNIKFSGSISSVSRCATTKTCFCISSVVASTSPDQGIANVTNDDFKAQAITWDLPSTTGIFANTFEKDGIRWYLKGLQKSQKDIGFAITKVYEYKDCNWGLLAPFFNLELLLEYD
ncbi:LCI fold-containing protein [Bacillus mojavensis]|uniref:LCI fold-containing protein n=1 Tax=Bacillus mojavensis TaxID=72360 RepID=UPI0039A55B23